MQDTPTFESIVASFQYVAKTFPYYQAFLREKGIDPRSIATADDFYTHVPPISKEDIFLRYALEDLSPHGNVCDYRTAIVSSGTSGVFSYGIMLPEEIEQQRDMIDRMIVSFFQTTEVSPIIINALPMGVSFVSSFPVIPTGTRSDIVCEAIKIFGSHRPVVLITDAHILKKVLEDGLEKGIDFAHLSISCIVGGSWFPNSLTQYLRNILRGGHTEYVPHTNEIFATFGVTEVGLNLCAAPPDLSAVRHLCATRREVRSVLMPNDEEGAVPTFMYGMSPEVDIEVMSPDMHGIGDLVVTHLREKKSTMLVRYATGDRVRHVDRNILESLGVPLMLPYPVYAVYGRAMEKGHECISPLRVEELLYDDQSYAQLITGHFFIQSGKTNPYIEVQMKQNSGVLPEKNVDGIPCRGVPYREFTHDLELSFDRKWKHQ